MKTVNKKGRIVSRGKRLESDIIIAIKNDYEHGYSISEIAEKHKISFNTARKWIQKDEVKCLSYNINFCSQVLIA